MWPRMQPGRRAQAMSRHLRRHHRPMEIVEEGRGLDALARRLLGQTDRRIERILAEVDRPIGFGHPDIQPRMAGVERRQPGDQPAHRQRADAREVQFALPGPAQGQERALDAIEGPAQRLGEPPPRLGQAQAVPRSLGQPHAAMAFEPPDLAADGAVRDAKLVGRQVHPPQPGEGLEGAQGGERRQASLGHGSLLAAISSL